MFKKKVFIENEYTYSTNSSSIFAFGNNGRIYRCDLRKNTTFELFSKEIIKKVEARFCNNVLFLSQNGKDITKYMRSFYYYGSPTKRKIKLLSEIGIYNQKIKNIFTLSRSTFVLLENGNLLAFGKNEKNQLGIRTNGFDIEKPTTIDTSFLSFNEKIKDIQGYKYFSILLTNRGNVFSTGYGIDGQIGHQGYGRVRFDYIKHLPMFRIKQIAAGYDHSLFLTKDNTVYGCGKNEYGELSSLGIENPYKRVLIPKELGIKNVIKIEAGYSSSIFTVLSGGRIQFFVCGKLFNSDRKKSCFVPHEVKFGLSSSLDFVDLHFGETRSVFVCRDGELYESFSSGFFNHGSKELKPNKMHFKVKMIPIKNTTTNFTSLLFEKQRNYQYTNLEVVCFNE